ncbi:MAG: DUF3849 domain-containing protein [Lachnospiraceae bacterium]|nr:DUF3849 domain-containing protein [Lachnospiraceae bacterium]
MAANRDEKMKEITERLEQGVQEFFTSERYADYLRTMSQFHSYSFNNTLLIAMQRPESTLVAGYRTWQKKFNRHVKRGEEGIQIISPVPIREKETLEKVDEKTGEPILKADGQPETEEIVHVIPRFRVATVFDLDQTEGDPLPDLGIQELTAGAENYEFFLRAMEQISPVPIRFNETSGEAKGYYDNGSKEIVIQQGMGELQTLKTAIHETAHAILHDRDRMKAQGVQKDKMTIECEAESISFCVCSAFQMDTSSYAFPYIASWSSNKEMKELRASMDTIRHTAAEMIDGITEAVQNLQREQAQYTSVELFGTPALFDTGRIKDEDIPAGMYRYEMRGSNQDPAVPIMIENHVEVHHAASILTAYPVPLPECGSLRLGEGLNFGKDGMISVQDYRQTTAGLSFPDMEQRMQNAVICANEELLFSGKEEQYAIYQIDRTGPGKDYFFMNLDYVEKHNLAVKGSDYRLVYGGILQPTENLDTLYEKFNIGRPDDFKGHSLSVSDVVLLKRGGEAKAHYVNSVGFKELPDFIQERKSLWEQQWRQVTEFTDSIGLDGHEGTWHTAGQMELVGETIYLMENNEFGSDAAKVAVNAKGDVVAEDLWNGFDDGFHKAAAEYFAGKGVAYERPEPVAEKRQEVTETAETNPEENAGQEQKEPVEPKPESVGQKDVENQGTEAVETAEAAVSASESERVLQDMATPVYMQTPAYAREHGELEQYRRSRSANIACKTAIEQAISDNYDGRHLKDGALKPVLEQFSENRIAYVLASTLKLKDWDRRFSQSNKEWVASVPIGEEISPFGNDRRTEWMVESHPAVLDGFVGMFRHEVLEQSRENEKMADKVVSKEKELTSDEIANFEEISREYYPHMRTSEVVFSCEVRGEPDVLTYELSQHDEGESYSLHTKNHDIWDRMSRKELEKLEFVVSREVTFSTWKKEIEQADSADALREVEYGMMDTENLNLSDAQRERLYEMMEEKGKSFPESQREERVPDSQGDGQYPDLDETTEKSDEPQGEKVKVAFYYVDSDPYGEETESIYQECSDVDLAIRAYHEMPNHFEKELGMVSTEEPPSRMALVQCKNGIDTMYDIEGASLSGKWVTPETVEAQQKVQNSLAVHDVEIAYYFEKENRYLTIQSVSEGYGYAIYDSLFHEIDGGIYDNPDISVEEALEEILSEAGISSWPAHRKVMDYGKLSDKVQTAELEAIKPESETPEQRATISFYVAECMEFPVLGEYHEDIGSLQEAMALYEQIPAERMNGIKGIGFTLSDGSMYDGMSYELMSVGIVNRDLVEEIPHFKESPLVQEALAELETVYRSPHSAEQTGETKEMAAAESTAEPLKRPQEEKTAEQGRNDIGGSTIATSGSRKGVTVADNPDSRKEVAATATAASGSRKESVLQALRDRRAKIKAKEPEKPKQEIQNCKKGIQEL